MRAHVKITRQWKSSQRVSSSLLRFGGASLSRVSSPRNAICSRVTRDVALRTSARDRRLAASQALCVRSNHPPFALVAHFQYPALRLRSPFILEKARAQGGKVSAAHTLHSFYVGPQGTSEIVPLRIIK